MIHTVENARPRTAAHRIDDAGKLDQQTVAGGLDDAPVVLCDLRIDELAAQRLEAFERAFLVRPQQPQGHRQLVTSGQLNCVTDNELKIYCQHTLQISAQILNFWVLEALCSAAVT